MSSIAVIPSLVHSYIAASGSAFKAPRPRSFTGYNRMRRHCFPYVESSDLFTSVNTDSSYATEFLMPYRIRQDNALTKALFVIRNPLERMYSHYKYLYSTMIKYSESITSPGIDINVSKIMPRFDILVEIATARNGPLGQLREMFASSGGFSSSSAVPLDTVVRQFYAVASWCTGLYRSIYDGGHAFEFDRRRTWSNVSWNADSIDPETRMWLRRAISKPEGDNSIISAEEKVVLAMAYELLMHSVYLPSILHYGRVLGMSNILVINSDDLDPRNIRRFSKIMSAIYSYLGLSDFDISSESMHKEEPVDVPIPLSHQMSLQSHRRLKAYFNIFNDKLALATGLNLTTWKNSQPASGLAIQNININAMSARRAKDGVVTDGPLFSDPLDASTLPPAWFEEQSGYSPPASQLSSVSEIGRSLFRWWLPRGNTGEASSGSTSSVAEDVSGGAVGSLASGGSWFGITGSIFEALLPRGLVILPRSFIS